MEQISQPETDPRVLLVLNGLSVDTGTMLDAETPLTIDALESRLVWNESLNMATLPTDEAGPDGEPLFHVLVAHSTLSDEGLMAPDLHFGDRPEEYKTRAGNVYGTGFYVANRREAAIRCNEEGQGRSVGAFLTSQVSMGEVADHRRRLAREVCHLGSMALTETIAPRLLGERKVASYLANRADRQMTERRIRLRLLNEAPRGRAEKMGYEAAWRYDQVPPQYALLRLPMLRIGTYQRPEERPVRHGVLSMYTRRFWQAAARNARDMKRLGAGR